MPRKMYVSDEMGLDNALADVAEDDVMSALIWPWLIPYLDDWGRGDANPRRIKAKIFPMFDAITTSVIAKALDGFVGAGLLHVYTVEGKPYMSVSCGADKWFEYQSHVHGSKRTQDKSRYPAPGAEVMPRPAQSRDTNTESREGESEKEELREVPRESAEAREEPRDAAQFRASPSPSLRSSPSPSPHFEEKTPPECPKKDTLAPQGAAAGANHALDADFDTFWQAYPNHQAKDPARRTFAKLRPPPELLERLLEAITEQKRGEQWQRDIVPHAATWLNSRRWTDEPPPAASTVRGSPTKPPPPSAATVVGRFGKQLRNLGTPATGQGQNTQEQIE